MIMGKEMTPSYLLCLSYSVLNLINYFMFITVMHPIDNSFTKISYLFFTNEPDPPAMDL